MKPLGDRVIIRPNKEEEITPGGIHLAKAIEDTPWRGIVVEVGPGHRLENGTVVPLEVKPGDKVIFSKFEQTPLEVDEEKLIIISADNILAIFQG